MARLLRYSGFVVLALSVWLAIAGAVDWVSDDVAERFSALGFKAGALLLAAGVLLAILSPISRAVRSGRCVRCGAPTERGQAYCLDHMREALNEYRDQTRPGLLNRPKHRG